MLKKYLKFQYLAIIMAITSCILAACGEESSSTSSQDDVITIGIVNQFDFFEPILEGFKAQMTESGFIEGEDVVYVYNGPVGFIPTDIRPEVQNLLDQDIDLFLSLGSSPSTEVSAVLEENDLSAVFASVTNPEKQGLVDTLIAPGGRMTGVNIGGPIISKSMEWLLTVAPNRQRVHVFYIEGERLATPQLEDLQTVSDQLNIELVLHPVETAEDVYSITEGMSPDEDVIFSIASEVDVAAITTAASENNIALGTSTLVGATTLTGPSIDFEGQGRQASLLAQQIIRGADAGSLPVEPAQYILLLNLEYAETMGMNIPDSVIQQAGEVVRIEPVPEATPEVTPEMTEQASDS